MKKGRTGGCAHFCFLSSVLLLKSSPDEALGVPKYAEHSGLFNSHAHRAKIPEYKACTVRVEALTEPALPSRRGRK